MLFCELAHSPSPLHPSGVRSASLAKFIITLLGTAYASSDTQRKIKPPRPQSASFANKHKHLIKDMRCAGWKGPTPEQSWSSAKVILLSVTDLFFVFHIFSILLLNDKVYL